MGNKLSPTPSSAEQIDWAYIYGRIVTVTKWTFEYVGSTLTYPEALALFAYWDKCPPIHESIAAAFQVKPKVAAVMPQGDQMQVMAAEMASAGFPGAIRHKKKGVTVPVPPDHPMLLRMREKGVEVA